MTPQTQTSIFALVCGVVFLLGGRFGISGGRESSSVFMLDFGARGPEPGWLRGYGVGGFMAGALEAWLVTVMKREMAQPDALLRNGGPAPPLDSSGATEGPPSTS